MAKPTSVTKTDTNVVERVIGDKHYKTTVSDGKDSVTREGRTAEEAERRASETWKEEKDRK
jgi:hypothetical protein